MRLIQGAAMIPDPEAAMSDAEGDWLTRAEASIVLTAMGVRMKPATLARIWSTAANGPPVRHIRSKPYYPRALLEAWGRSQISELRTGAPAAAQGRRRG